MSKQHKTIVSDNGIEFCRDLENAPPEMKVRVVYVQQFEDRDLNEETILIKSKEDAEMLIARWDYLGRKTWSYWIKSIEWTENPKLKKKTAKELLKQACESVELNSCWDKPPFSDWYYAAKELLKG